MCSLSFHLYGDQRAAEVRNHRSLSRFQLEALLETNPTGLKLNVTKELLKWKRFSWTGLIKAGADALRGADCLQISQLGQRGGAHLRLQFRQRELPTKEESHDKTGEEADIVFSGKCLCSRSFYSCCLQVFMW